MQAVGVIGAGAWGTALATVARRAGRDVTVWAFEPEVAASITTGHLNTRFLPGVTLDPAIVATTDLAAVAALDMVLLVTPAQHVRRIATAVAPHLRPATPVVICAKGIEKETCALMTEAAAALRHGTVMVLSGPSFAAEVARGLPTALTLAADDLSRARAVAEALGSRSFRPYVTEDVIGAQIGGAVKNVLAIGCGIAEGRRLGENAKAALLTRGLAEIVRLAVACGGRAETLMGLSGLGDLVLTATSVQSRNFSLGVALGQGKTLAEILGGRTSVTEGVTTAEAVVALAARQRVDMPICDAIHRIVSQGASIDSVMADLLERPLRDEATGSP
jgi:glycerol-3-phosphate dehydrogenase (NAD(P)+)